MNTDIFETATRVADRVIPVRPTLIVGLGGTGSLICQWTHYLIREVFGTIPDFVKFLVLDSDAMEEGGPVQGSFPASDFYNVFEDVHLGDVVRDFDEHQEYHPYLKWLQKLDLQSAVTERGCQGISRLGRVVFFETSERVIHRAVYDRFLSLADHGLKYRVSSLPPERQFELTGSPVVHITGSICGGTGSGMLIDLAYCMQRWAREHFTRPAEIVGHLMLPEAFAVDEPRIRDKLRAVAGSLLRQIEFLMDSRREDVIVEYPNGVRGKFGRQQAPFHACYLLNGYGDDGGDTRDDLAQMIGRMIRAMTVEPVGKTIASDVNNKQLDILAKNDRHNKHLLCFSSYGLRYGTGGASSKNNEDEHDMARRWICESLTRIGNIDDDTVKVDKNSIRESIDRALSFDTVRSHLAKPEPFHFDPSSARTKAEQVLRDQLSKQIAGHFKQLQGQAWKSFEKEGKGLLAQALGRFKVGTHAGNGSAQSGTHPTLQEAAYADAWRSELQDRHQATAGNKVDGRAILPSTAVVRAILQAVSTDLKTTFASGRYGSNYNDFLLSPGQVNGAVEKAMTKYWGKLQEAACFPAYKEILRALSGQFHHRLESLKRLAAAAQLELQNLNTSHASLHFTTEAYGTALIERSHPDSILEGVKPDEHALNVRDEFYGYVRQIRSQFLEGLPAGESTSRQDGVRLHSLLDHEVRTLTQWENSYTESLQSEFRSQVDPQNPSAHRFYKPLESMVRGARPKVATDPRARHTKSMHLTVSQNPAHCCIEGLLRAQAGRDYREARVSNGYVERTDQWVQLMRFQFGFCLEALANFDEYQAATRRYLEPIDFDEDDLWLDPEWMDNYFENYLPRVARSRTDGKPGEEDGEVAADQAQAAIRSCHQKAELAFDKLLKSCKEFSFGAQAESMDCLERIVSTREKVSRALDANRVRLPEIGVHAITDPERSSVEQLQEHLKMQSPLFHENVRAAFDELLHEWDKIVDDTSMT